MRTTHLKLVTILLCTSLTWATGCSTDADTDNGPADQGQTSGGNNYGTTGKTDITEDQEAFLRAYEEVRSEADAMSSGDFTERYAPNEALSELSFDPTTASDLGRIAELTGMNEAQGELLKQNGFVVLEGTDRHTFENAYSDLYFADMPVLITTDSMLYALHRSYDRILQEMEQTVLAGATERMLKLMHEDLAERLEQGSIPAAQAEAAQDVDVYLTIGRSLIGETPVQPVHDDARVTELVNKILAGVSAEGPDTLTLFGAQSLYDYSQMRPRGHYTDDPLLQRYFKTMMWLGRTEMALVNFVDGQPVFNRVAFDSAFLMNSLLSDSGAMRQWTQINKAIELMVGERDSMNPIDMEAFRTDNSLDSLDAIAGADDETLKKALLNSPYGLQRIMSQIIYTDPKEPEVTLPRVYLLMGQRFVIDSYVFHHVTYDRLQDPRTGEKMRRMLPDPLDVQFALGSNAAADLLAPELERYPYQGTLHELRFLVENHPQDFWEANLYNGWLNALRALNDDTHRGAMPEAMQTRAWDHKTLNTQMASWAELRHDTLLYAKQSYSAGVGCEYPKAYVEPYPEFYQRMAHLGELGMRMASELEQEGFDTARVKSWFENMSGIMSTLEAISTKELNDEPLTEEEWNFLRATIEREMVGCGEVQYDGWYASLFFSRADLGSFKPTIADVHTAPTDENGNNVGWVLHGATGATQLMVFTLTDCEGVHAYVGPVSSYYSVLGEQYKRYTDAEWEQTIYSGQLQRPAWTSSFVR